MKKTTLQSFLFTLVFLFSATSIAQNGKSMWTKTTKEKASRSERAIRKTEPKKAEFYQLDVTSLKAQLVNAPNRDLTSISNLIIDFPIADGTFESFRVSEASIMAPELEAKFPELKSYSGYSVKSPSTLIRFSVTTQGLHLMMLSPKYGAQFIDPYTKTGNDYIVYAKRDLPALDQTWECGVTEDDQGIDMKSLGNSYEMRDTGGNFVRNFRTAIACTIEYSQFHWEAAGLTGADTVAARKVAVMAAIVVTMTRNNFVYERDFSIRMTLVGNNDSVVFITSDSFSNDTAASLINESQTVIDATIGSGNYDVGHTFSTGGGGLAQLNSPCTGNKARGITGGPSPVGDPYDIDFVAHELGHQFGGPHTFNGNQGNCAGGNREATNAYEPGSGTTIMAYAGICATDNVQANSDAYFHQKSLQMIWDNVSTGNSTCANQTIATNNGTPTAEAGNDFIIPMSTPYMLVGSSTDPDGIDGSGGNDEHTYTWEQYDLGPSGVPADNTATGPLVRSFEGTTNPIRYIPRMQDILQNGGVSTTWEKLSNQDRNINFELTVRDNHSTGGKTANDNMTVNVETTAGPFTVTSQPANTSWIQNTTETVTWNRANTHTGTVNTPNVDILLSIDGGMTFPMVLASAVPNDGTHDITVPNITEDNCIVMVKGSGNIFFNVSGRIGIGYTLTTQEVCTTYNFSPNETSTPSNTQFDLFEGYNVADSGVITDVNVTYDVTGSNVGMHLAIISAAGTRAYLYVNSCGSGANMQVKWDDEAAAAIVCGNTPTTGDATLAAITTPEPLSGMDGEEMNGDWTFMIANIAADAKILNTVALEICKMDTVATLAIEDKEFDVFSLYPNPSDGVFNLSLSTSKAVKLELFDIRGRNIYSEKHSNNSDVFDTTLDFSSLASGIYMLRVDSDSKKAVKKIVIR